jgi:hypothetical protein
MARKNLVIRILIISSVACLIVASWYTKLENRRLKATNRELLQSRVYPYPLTSLEFQTPETRVVETGKNDEGRPTQRYLVFVSEDTCRFCAANMNHWETIIRSLKQSDQITVLMVVYGSVANDLPLTTDLKAADIPYRLLQVTDPIVFPLKTGLVGVPATLLLDTAMRPVLVHSGMMTDQIVQTFQKGVRGDLRGLSHPFLAGGPDEVLSAESTKVTIPR